MNNENEEEVGPPKESLSSDQPSTSPQTHQQTTQKIDTNVPISNKQPNVTQDVVAKAKPKKAVLILALIFATLIIFGTSGYYFVQDSKSKKPAESTPTSTISITPTQSNPVVITPTSGWEKYVSEEENISFDYPFGYEREDYEISAGGSVHEFNSKDKIFKITFRSRINLNLETREEYKTLAELNQTYQSQNMVTIENQKGIQYLPRAGSENVNAVVFFSTNMASIYTLELKTGEDAYDNVPATATEEEIIKGQEIFSQIISTFSFGSDNPEEEYNSDLSCNSNGETYKNGERFKIDCNACTCQNGQVACTKMGCPE